MYLLNVSYKKLIPLDNLIGEDAILIVLMRIPMIKIITLMIMMITYKTMTMIMIMEAKM